MVLGRGRYECPTVVLFSAKPILFREDSGYGVEVQ